MKEKILLIVSRETEKCVAEATTFEELGLDSLELLNLVSAVEQETGAQIDDSKLGDMNTVGDLIRVAELAA